MAPVQNPGATQVQIDLHPFPGVAQVQFFWVFVLVFIHTWKFVYKSSVLKTPYEFQCNFVLSLVFKQKLE
jgi:hypothetical protein